MSSPLIKLEPTLVFPFAVDASWDWIVASDAWSAPRPLDARTSSVDESDGLSVLQSLYVDNGLSHVLHPLPEPPVYISPHLVISSGAYPMRPPPAAVLPSSVPRQVDLPASKSRTSSHQERLRTYDVAGCVRNSQCRDRCIRHGGGKRCTTEGCPRGAQSRGKCKAHGGGLRCKADGCDRSSHRSGLCRSHGGGKLCDYPGCTKGTQRHGKCSAHGGCRRCSVEGCVKADRGGGFCRPHKMEQLDA